MRTIPFCFLLVNTLLARASFETKSGTKSGCLGDSVELFQNITLHEDTLLSLYRSSMLIAMWTQAFHSTLDEKFYLDSDGNIWIRNLQLSDEDEYFMVWEDRMYNVEEFVDLTVLVAPGMRCKPEVKRVDTELVAFLKGKYCGTPAASVYWLGYKWYLQNQSAILPGKEAGEYQACIKGPSLRCSKRSKATDYCSSFRIAADGELIPNIYVVETSIVDMSLVLQCQSDGNSTESFRWRHNGRPIFSNAKYFLTNDCLTIRTFNADDLNGIYTCMKFGSRHESDPYSIENLGPTYIKVNPNNVVVKEHDEMNVSCLTDCYPLCYMGWTKLEPLSGQINVLSEDAALHITHVTREMSGNYSCLVQNNVTGAWLESLLRLHVLYGPDDIFFNTSINIEVNEFDSVTILCTAKCFPECLIGWTKTYTGNLARSAVLNLVNVSTNSTYTCHARNPKIVTAAISETINVTVKIDTRLIPWIAIINYHLLGSSVVLQCHSFRMSKGRFSWSVNGSPINNSDKYSTDNMFLSVRHLTAEDQYSSYTCREPRSKLQSDPFQIQIYGPDDVILNTSKSLSKVYQFSTITASCSAHCFPPCLFRWTFSHTDVIINGAVLKIDNVTSNGSITCQATNPINMSVTVSETIDIMVKSENLHDATSSIDQDQDTGANEIDIPSIRYLEYIFPPIAGFGLIVCVIFCFLKKYMKCPRVTGVSSSNVSAPSDVGESLQVETLSQHYWTIVTNPRGEFSTTVEIDFNVELGGSNDQAHSDPMESDESINANQQNAEEVEAYTSQLGSEPIENQTNNSESVAIEEYIDPVPLDSMRLNEYLDLIPSDPEEVSEIIYPSHSEHIGDGGYDDPITSDQMRLNEYLELIPSDSVEFNENIHPTNSDLIAHAGYIHPIPSDSIGCSRSVDTISSQPEDLDGYIHPIPSENLASDRHLDLLSSSPLQSDACIDLNHADTVALEGNMDPNIAHPTEPNY